MTRLLQEPQAPERQLNLLVEGAIVMAQVCQDVSSAQRAKVAAKTILEVALR